MKGFLTKSVLAVPISPDLISLTLELSFHRKPPYSIPYIGKTSSSGSVSFILDKGMQKQIMLKLGGGGRPGVL